MFLTCIINQAIIEGSKRLKSTETIKRYLSICYGIKVGYKALSIRRGYLFMSGKLYPKTVLTKRDRVQQTGSI